MQDFLYRLTSRKFLLALAACVYIAVQVAGGAVTAADGFDAIWKIVVGYIAGEGAADFADRLKPSVPPAPAPVEPVAPTPNP